MTDSRKSSKDARTQRQKSHTPSKASSPSSSRSSSSTHGSSQRSESSHFGFSRERNSSSHANSFSHSNSTSHANSTSHVNSNEPWWLVDESGAKPHGSRRPSDATRAHFGMSSATSSEGSRTSARAFAGNLEVSQKTLILVIAFALIALILIARLVFLQVIQAEEYSEKALSERTSDSIVYARRGTIYDCNGNVLAVSIDGKNIVCDPTLITNAPALAAKLAEVLGGEYSYYLERLTMADARWVYLMRQATVAQAQSIVEFAENSNISGIYTEDTFIRQYPYGQVGGQVIGACSYNYDTNEFEGICGLEAYYDEILKGTNGRYIAELGRDGTPIAGGEHVIEAAVNGADIMISLDIELQAQVEERLAAAKDQYEGTSASCIMIDASTGEILVAASWPYFNPADRSEVAEGATSISCINSAIEPGSIFKTVSAMALLEENAMTPDDPQIECPAEIPADEYVVSDAHDRGDEVMTLREIIDRSSNVGISLSVENYLGFDKLYQYINAYELNECTGVDFPGEANGYLLEQSEWTKIQSYNITFGQGISVTPLQLTKFYGALLNDGWAITPHFMTNNLTTDEKITYESSELIHNKQAIPQMVDMLKGVVTDGTGHLAAIDGYNVAGKTSTAEIASEEGGYLDGVYNLGFLGFLADSSSNIVCFVGGAQIPYESTMTLVFKDIMSYAIERYRIAPL